MRGTAVYALRRAIDFDRSAVGGEARGGYAETRSDGRTRESASQEKSCKGARTGLHTAAGISGRSGGVRGLVEGWAEFSQPESVSGRHAGGSCGAVTPGAGAIFVPIRIVFSQALPAVGLYRHGAAYVKPPMDGV